MIGDTIKVNGVNCLVLNYIEGNPFVIALDLDIETKFSDKSNDYANSILRTKAEVWLKQSGIKTKPREIDLTAMDGFKGYGSLQVAVAPLTFDEYRKYNEIMRPHIKHWFWTVTPWGDPNKDNWGPTYVCIVGTNGNANYFDYNTSGGLAPAFILDKTFADKPQKELSDYTTEELLAELNKRIP